MKRLLILAASLALAAGCNHSTPYHVDDPLTISSPTPAVSVTKVDLTATEQGYVKAGNAMAFRFLAEMYDGKDLVLSPLSLQYALAMAASVDYMQNSRHHLYAAMDGFRVVALPYTGGKFFMYILLPDKNDLEGLVKKLSGIAWNDILASLTDDAEVFLKLPKFNIEEKYDLFDHLRTLGIRRAFDSGRAEFDRMFKASDFGMSFYVSSVIQKARISVAEWGTEAAAVTVIAMEKNSASGPGKTVEFIADHPFLFFIGESTSGTILFEGAYTGK